MEIATIIIVASLLIGTKFMDAWSTQRMAVGPGSEKNPLARRLMERWGVGPVCWGVFAFTVMYVSVLAWVAWMTAPWSLFVFVPGDLFVALVQGAVAHHNLTNSQNLITHNAERLMIGMERIIKR